MRFAELAVCGSNPTSVFAVGSAKADKSALLNDNLSIALTFENGSIANGRSWAKTDGDEPGVADGMKIDSSGNLYCCGSGGIHVFDVNGTRIGVIETPEVAANFTWGGDGLTDLYITATHSIYRLKMKVPGHV